MSSSSTITDANSSREAPCHPGEILREEYLPDFALTPDGLAAALGVTSELIEDVLSERAPVTADLALRLGRAFAQSPQMWMSLQARYDLALAARAANDLDEVRPIAAA